MWMRSSPILCMEKGNGRPDPIPEIPNGMISPFNLFPTTLKEPVAIFENAGWKMNRDGWLEKDGKIFEFNAHYE